MTGCSTGWSPKCMMRYMYTLPNIASCPTCSPPAEVSLSGTWPRWCFQAFLDCLTLPETNIAPENRPLEKEIPIESYHFWEQTVSFRECNCVTPVTPNLWEMTPNLTNIFEPLDADVPPSLIRWINCGNMPFGTPWVLPFGAASRWPFPLFQSWWARGSCLHSWMAIQAIHYKDVFEQNGMESSKNSRGNLDVFFCWCFFIQSSFTGWLISIKKTSPWIYGMYLWVTFFPSILNQIKARKFEIIYEKYQPLVILN